MNLRTAEPETITAPRAAARRRLADRGRALAWVDVIDRRRSEAASHAAAPTADFAECDCPEFCERDHDND